MGSPFRDAVFGNHKDFVRIADRGETVGDRDGCTVFSEFFQAFLDSAFAFVVQGAGRLVQDQDGRIFQKYTGNGDALFLSTGKAGSALTHKGVVSVREFLDKLMDICLFAASMISSMVASGFP